MTSPRLSHSSAACSHPVASAMFPLVPPCTLLLPSLVIPAGFGGNPQGPRELVSASQLQAVAVLSFYLQGQLKAAAADCRHTEGPSACDLPRRRLPAKCSIPLPLPSDFALPGRGQGSRAWGGGGVFSQAPVGPQAEHQALVTCTRTLRGLGLYSLTTVSGSILRPGCASGCRVWSGQ